MRSVGGKTKLPDLKLSMKYSTRKEYVKLCRNREYGFPPSVIREKSNGELYYHSRYSRCAGSSSKLYRSSFTGSTLVTHERSRDVNEHTVGLLGDLFLFAVTLQDGTEFIVQ